MFCILRLRNHGDVCTFITDDRKTAYLYYYTAMLFNIDGDSFLALFHKAEMILNNQEKHRNKRKNGGRGKKS